MGWPAVRNLLRRCRGFSLPELLVGLAVLSTLAAVAAPSLQGMSDSARVASASNELLIDLLLARSEGIKRRAPVVLCKSADGQTCAASGSWGSGWITFVDLDRDGARAATEPVLRWHGSIGVAVRMTSNASVADYVAYGADGGTRLTNGAFQAGTFTVCASSSGPASARQIVINATGRARVQKATVDSCP